ncbi:PIG-L family deacetylase [Candidatus Bathyarchaeota archaeon]|nr:PIG-L family deacetylase [Candidatus Bathyarchaeota archaeon]MBT4321192.1 PIG-L family deacetylase [Candidatus Bathyarchaeota archaeon]MBT4423655.1 PIG-L family deacetylase [Candidatus Bathyarchaeota archaeon]MBT5642463.1 PIG-L family deacetylase [Candidatus Bathyarchaeota archaeon]MBT6605141.1 PIG-L family deacetylase [Candidatus Bathyarchaeota archaeon]
MTGGLLAIVSHPDDETFGCGGTLAKHASAGKEVRVLCLTCNPRNRRDEFFNAVQSLDVDADILERDDIQVSPELIRELADYIDDFRPGTIITHLPFDYHREHKSCYGVVKEAIEWAAHTTMYEDAWLVERLLLMEVNTLIPSPSILVDVTNSYDAKEKAINQYSTQLAKFPWGYYPRVNRKKAELRGVQCDVELAEAFIEESLPRDGPFYLEKATALLV